MLVRALLFAYFEPCASNRPPGGIPCFPPHKKKKSQNGEYPLPFTFPEHSCSICIVCLVRISPDDDSRDYTLLVRRISQQVFNITNNVGQIHKLIACLGTGKDTAEVRNNL